MFQSLIRLFFPSYGLNMINFDVLSDIIFKTNYLCYYIWNSDYLDVMCLNRWFAFEVREVIEDDDSILYYCYEHYWEYPTKDDYGTKKRANFVVLDAKFMNSDHARNWINSKRTWYLDNTD